MEWCLWQECCDAWPVVRWTTPGVEVHGSHASPGSVPVFALFWPLASRALCRSGDLIVRDHGRHEGQESGAGWAVELALEAVDDPAGWSCCRRRRTRARRPRRGRPRRGGCLPTRPPSSWRSLDQRVTQWMSALTGSLGRGAKLRVVVEPPGRQPDGRIQQGVAERIRVTCSSAWVARPVLLRPEVPARGSMHRTCVAELLRLSPSITS